MSIQFKQVANANFADSNALLKLAIEQSNKAAEGFKGTLDTVIGNVEDANLAKIKQLVDGQTREQLQDPEYQQLMQEQIANITASTGGTYDPLKAQEYQQGRINTLMDRETAQSNLDASAIVQEGNRETNANNKIMNPLKQGSELLKYEEQQRTRQVEDFASTFSYLSSTEDSIKRAMQNETDPIKLAQYRKDLKALEQQAANLAETTDPVIRDMGIQYLTNRDIGNEGSRLDNASKAAGIEDTASKIVTREQNANTNALALLQRGAASSNKERQEYRTTAKAELEEAGISPNTLLTDDTLDFKSYSGQITYNATQAALQASLGVNGAEPINFLKEANSTLKDVDISDKQRRDLFEVLDGKNLSDDEKLMFLQKVAVNPLLAKDWFSNKGAMEKNLKIALDEYNNSDKGRAIANVKRASYAKSLAPLIKRGMSNEEIVKKLKLRYDLPDMRLMPVGIQEASGYTLWKANQEDQAAAQAKLDAAKAREALAQERYDSRTGANRGKPYNEQRNVSNSRILQYGR